VSADWTAPLPDFSRPAISRRLSIGGLELTIQVNPILRGIDEEADTAVVQIRVLHRDRLLAPADLGVPTDVCLNIWSYLCNKLTEAVYDFYGPSQRFVGEPNPRLGCWGPRPDLLERGLGESDCGLAVVIGLATWTVGAKPIGTDADLVQRVFEAVVESLGYWVLIARRTASSGNPAETG
jgi:hypothetical protein